MLDNAFLGDVLFYKLLDPPPVPRLLPGAENPGTAHWLLVVSLGAGLSQTQPMSSQKPGKGQREAHSRWLSCWPCGDGLHQVCTMGLALGSHGSQPPGQVGAHRQLKRQGRRMVAGG